MEKPAKTKEQVVDRILTILRTRMTSRRIITPVFRDMDVDHSGQLDYEEFEADMRRLGLNEPQKCGGRCKGGRTPSPAPREPPLHSRPPVAERPASPTRPHPRLRAGLGRPSPRLGRPRRPAEGGRRLTPPSLRVGT